MPGKGVTFIEVKNLSFLSTELILAFVDSGDFFEAGELGELVFGLFGLVDFSPELLDELLNRWFFGHVIW